MATRQVGGEGAPPVTNRGAQNAQAPQAFVDWVAFTLPATNGLEVVNSLCGIIQPRKYGMRGYTHSGTICGSGSVGWAPQRPEQGVHVVLPATALAWLAEWNPAYKDVEGLLVYLLDLGAKITRLDVALDDRRGDLSMDQVGEAVVQGAFVSRWKDVQEQRGLRGSTGRTFYFGSRVSESFLRIYDKQAERIDKEQPDPGHWIRVEVEYKGGKAQAVAKGIAREGIRFAVGVLAGLIEFKTPGEDQTMSRWAVAPWWACFLTLCIRKVRLGVPKVAKTLDTVKAWLWRQVAPSMAFVTESSGGTVDWFYTLLQDGRLRMGPSYRQLLESGQCGWAAG